MNDRNHKGPSSLRPSRPAAVALVLVLVTACSAQGSVAPAPVPALGPRAIVEALAADALTGRDNDTPGSLAAQKILVGQVSQFAKPAFPSAQGTAGFLQPFDRGTNILAVVPGGDLADQYVVIGAHYDHLGTDCPTSDPKDNICNGATDNAAGVAAAISAARAIAASGTPRRSVLLALWDKEEDGLLGSKYYTTSPVVPLAKTVAYVNFDIQGADLLPSLTTTTLLLGAETGGSSLIASASAAAKASALRTLQFSLVFGEGRSDHANFVAAGVPSVFFTDSTSSCYHTAQDDTKVVDYTKLDQEIAAASALASDLVTTDTPPIFTSVSARSTYSDAVAMLAIATGAESSLNRFDPAGQSTVKQYLAAVRAIVKSGAAKFDEAASATLITGAPPFVDAVTQGRCEAFAPGG